jgi:type IV pilus assembly protein PilB
MHPSPRTASLAPSGTPHTATGLIKQRASLAHPVLQLLLQQKRITFAQAQAVLEHTDPVVVACVRSGAIDGMALSRLLASAFKIPWQNLEDINPRKVPRQMIEAHRCRQHWAMPIDRKDSSVVVAVADPSDPAARQAMEQALRTKVQWVVANVEQLERMLDFYHPASTESEAVVTTDADEEGNAVAFWQRILAQAVAWRASDIHIEPQASGFHVRLRVDGLLRPLPLASAEIRGRLVSHIKVMAQMDIAEKRLPQDGRMAAMVEEKTIDLRVSSLPTLHGEKLVVRLLGDKHRPALAELGYEADDLSLLLDALRRSNGMIIVTGPTGSGKTLSLYACLDVLNLPHVNIASIEDPCEMVVDGVNQVNVNERAGLDFATGLRAFLRQDPDVLMVGEIRDRTTAGIAIQAAQTGHLVLTTLHTNDAPGVLTRLMHMGIEAFQLAASVHLITAQRLVRRLCPHCKQASTLAEELRRLGLSSTKSSLLGFASEPDITQAVYRPQGCAHCLDGYMGRVGIFQIMPITADMATLLVQNQDAQTLAHHAQKQGMRTLRQAGWMKVFAGLTSVQEVLGVTHA